MSTSSPELLVQLDRSRPRSLRAQLESSLRSAVRTGRLRPGSRLPSSRALAADLQITRGVEDDYDAEYRYDREPVGALQGVAPDHVIYIGSLSKSLAPALRLGWLVVPPALRDELIAARAVTDRFTTPIIQAAAAEFLRRGDLDRHLRRARRSYRQRRDVLIGAVQRHIPGTRATGISAGLHVVVRLPDGMDPVRIAASAGRHGILLHPLDHYRASPARAGAPALVMGYSRLTCRQIEEGIQRLASITDLHAMPPQASVR